MLLITYLVITLRSSAPETQLLYYSPALSHTGTRTHETHPCLHCPLIQQNQMHVPSSGEITMSSFVLHSRHQLLDHQQIMYLLKIYWQSQTRCHWSLCLYHEECKIFNRFFSWATISLFRGSLQSGVSITVKWKEMKNLASGKCRLYVISSVWLWAIQLQ